MPAINTGERQTLETDHHSLHLRKVWCKHWHLFWILVEISFFQGDGNRGKGQGKKPEGT